MPERHSIVCVCRARSHAGRFLLRWSGPSSSRAISSEFFFRGFLDILLGHIAEESGLGLVAKQVFQVHPGLICVGIAGEESLQSLIDGLALQCSECLQVLALLVAHVGGQVAHLDYFLIATFRIGTHWIAVC